MMNRDMQPKKQQRGHTDHDLAGWMDDGGNLGPTSGEAAVSVPSSNGPTVGYTQNFWIGAKNVVNGSEPMPRHLTRSQL